MSRSVCHSIQALDEHLALRAILEGTASETGEKFFQALVKSLAQALDTHGAWVTEFYPESRRLKSLALWLDGQLCENCELEIAGTPCEVVLREGRMVHIPDRLAEIFPKDSEALTRGLVSYIGVPLKGTDCDLLGHLALFDRRPMPEKPHTMALFRIFASQAAAELKRLRAEAAIREREEHLSLVMSSTWDAIIELDADFKVSLVNPAAAKAFKCSQEWLEGKDFTRLLSAKSRKRIQRCALELDYSPPGRQSLWIPGGLEATQADGGAFAAEATISCFQARQRRFYALVLRSVSERIDADRELQSLRAETEYLRREVNALQNFDEIVGRSPALSRALAEVRQVAATDTTVLILGETGTGKELFARAIQAASARRDKPMIKVNCGAVPAALIESEFFGHEKGAFTGATSRREGRFSLADGGTLFLDEISELPLDLQSKLLRVIQEGEFEPVGSSKTRKVDIRLITATNRDLLQQVKEGKFRQDLYYRLHVFPLEIPPLRERGEDIPLLASAYAERLGRRMGRKLEPLSEDDILRLKAYNWPGNVRELVSVIERAVITAEGGRINLSRALPGAEPQPWTPGFGEVVPPARAPATIHTVQELENFERQNIIRALEAAGWRVAGESGAARLLGINPSTLNSRMKALGIRRTRPPLEHPLPGCCASRNAQHRISAS
jgi:PAS domain S-box-containing protein